MILFSLEYYSVFNFHFHVIFFKQTNASLQLDLYDLNNPQIHYLKIRILSETSILYLIRYASVILIVGLHR